MTPIIEVHAAGEPSDAAISALARLLLAIVRREREAAEGQTMEVSDG